MLDEPGGDALSISYLNAWSIAHAAFTTSVR